MVFTILIRILALSSLSIVLYKQIKGIIEDVKEKKKKGGEEEKWQEFK